MNRLSSQRSALRPVLRLGTLFVAALTGGCIITAADDDDTTASGTDTSESSPSGPGSSDPSDPSSGSAETTDSSSATATAGGTTGGLPPDCSDNLLQDPSFEQGTPNNVWDESSVVFDSPICDASCTNDEGATARTGSWWVWFGGIEQPDTASVAQTVTIAPGTAFLSFYFEINAAQGTTGDDVFAVEIDGSTVFMLTDADMADYANYTEIVLDVSDYADGGAHSVAFVGEISGAGLTNFFVDDVTLVECVEGGTTTTATGTGTDTATDTDPSTGTDTDPTTGTGTDTDTGTGTGTTSGTGTTGTGTGSSSTSA